MSEMSFENLPVGSYSLPGGLFIRKTSVWTKYYSDAEFTVLHREDGPAMEFKSGLKEWWLNGKKHREDGPAVIYPNGGVAYWKDGILQRDGDLPAVEFPNGYKGWYKDGKIVAQQQPGGKAPVPRSD